MGIEGSEQVGGDPGIKLIASLRLLARRDVGLPTILAGLGFPRVPLANDPLLAMPVLFGMLAPRVRGVCRLALSRAGLGLPLNVGLGHVGFAFSLSLQSSRTAFSRSWSRFPRGRALSLLPLGLLRGQGVSSWLLSPSSDQFTLQAAPPAKLRIESAVPFSSAYPRTLLAERHRIASFPASQVQIPPVARRP